MGAEKAKQKNDKLKSDKLASWDQPELNVLAKAVTKFPGGTVKRWECIGNMLRNAGFTRTQDEIIAKIKEMQTKSSYQTAAKKAVEEGGKEAYDDYLRRNQRLVNVQEENVDKTVPTKKADHVSASPA